LELREDYPTWSACDYNKLAYRAKELAGKGWKQALIGLEVEGIIEKRGSGRRPGERNIEPELIPLVEQVLSSWKVPSVDTEPNSARPRAGTREQELKKGQEPIWDLFICHASEDKNEVARPLAEALRTKGMKVWYDDFTLTLGDSLRRSIDSGLTRSRYGIVILSPNFFKKDWPQKELDGLVSKEDGRQKVILPIWHQVRREDVLEYSPTLADKLAVSTQDGLDAVVNAILEVVIQKKKEVRSTQGTRGTGLNRMTVAQASESLALTPTTEAAPTTPQFEPPKSRPIPPLVYEVTQMQSNGVRRDLPSVGFNLDNRADYPVRIRVFAEVVLNGKSIGYPSEWSGLYNGKRIWSLNPKGRTGSGIKDGNFTIPLDSIRKDETLMIKVIIKVVDDEFDSPLPVGWVYDPKRNDWYYEPSV
jgi:hypothetical protein